MLTETLKKRQGNVQETFWKRKRNVYMQGNDPNRSTHDQKKRERNVGNVKETSVGACKRNVK